MGFPKRGVCKLRASLNSLRLQQMLRCIACDEKTRDKLTQEIHEGHHVGMMISKFVSSSTFPSCSSFQVLQTTSWNIILVFFLQCCVAAKHQQNTKFHKYDTVFPLENPSNLGIPCLSTYWLANAVPKPAVLNVEIYPHLPLRVGNLKPEFVAVVGHPPPYHSIQQCLEDLGTGSFFSIKLFLPKVGDFWWLKPCADVGAFPTPNVSR